MPAGSMSSPSFVKSFCSTFEPCHLHKKVLIITHLLPKNARISHKMPIFYLWTLRMTLTFDKRSRVLYATRLHMTLDIFTKFYDDTTITYQVMARTSQKMPIFFTSNCDLDLWQRVMGLIHDTPTHDTEQFDKVLWSYNNYLSSYGPDKP